MSSGPESSRTIDDVGPMPVVRPAGVAELCDLVRQTTDGTPLYPQGGGTMLDFGRPPERPGRVVDLRSLDQVIDFPARDMTLTVQAGITLARLRDLVRAEGLRLPVDVPLADRATLGGVIATNTSGPRRLGFGTLRDYVIGLSAVNDEGHEIKAGGRVVKNVAGYDLCKLFIGSLGTLGIVSQVTIKLKPTPEEHALVALDCAPDAVGSVLDRIHASRTRPVTVELLNDHAVRRLNQQHHVGLRESPWGVVVGYEDNREAVGWQVRQLVKELPSLNGHGFDVRVGEPADPLWHALAEHTLAPDATLTLKANLLPSVVADFCRVAVTVPSALALQAHAGSGIVYGHAINLTLEQARAMLTRLTGVATGAKGNIVLPRCPTAWKRELPVWGVPRPDAWLMQRVKETLDPRRIFNPGRFIDGI